MVTFESATRMVKWLHSRNGDPRTKGDFNESNLGLRCK